MANLSIIRNESTTSILDGVFAKGLRNPNCQLVLGNFFT